MQIRLTVLAPRSGHTPGRACDVLVTAPAGTALAAVASGLATAVAGPDASGTVVLYAGRERLDPDRCALGEPPLTDGAVLSLQVPGADDTPSEVAPAQLHVVAGPDAGGVHLLHAGRIRIGRSAEADVPLDDPDVSRLHCEVTVSEDGRIAVADLGSTNGTTLEGLEVGRHAVRLTPGALLRLGESSLRLTTGCPAAAFPTAPDGEGHLRIVRPVTDRTGTDRTGTDRTGTDRTGTDRTGTGGTGLAGPETRRAGSGRPPGTRPTASEHGESAPGTDAARYGAAGPPPIPPQDNGARAAASARARQSAARDADGRGLAGDAQSRTLRTYGSGAPDDTHSQATGQGGYPQDPWYGGPANTPQAPPWVPDPRGAADEPFAPQDGTPVHSRAAAHGTTDDAQRHDSVAQTDEGTPPYTGSAGTRRQATPTRGTELPAGAARRRGGIGAWARRLTGSGRGEDFAAEQTGARSPGGTGRGTVPAVPVQPWPDPAEVLLTALGPGPRLWERDSRHPESFVVRLGTTDHAASGEADPAPSLPMTVALREAGSLGLAGPRERLTGLARSAVAQLAALHSPADLEIVLISTDRARDAGERRQDWGWLGWLPHVRPAHGQDCRLLLAYDRDQAVARTNELIRRLNDGPLGPGWPSAGPGAVAEAAARHTGSHTVVIVDGDPGSAALRENTARLAAAGSACGIHLICLTETPDAAPLSRDAALYESARASSLPFRECGTVALLTGDVGTALHLLRTTAGRPAGRGAVGVVDAVSAAWADRFGRALAPLREAAGDTGPGPAAELPRSARLLDELGLARATPASLLARWASAADRSGDCTVVLGAGARGAVSVDLAVEGPHLLIEGPTGSGRTELLRSVAASLAAAGRPDQLGLLLVDGAGGERGEGLAACTELPHVTEHLVASDPVRMRDFARALGAELKRRAELLGRLDFTEWHSRYDMPDTPAGRRQPGAGGPRPVQHGAAPTGQGRTGERSAQGPRTAGPAESRTRDDQRAGADPATGFTVRLSTAATQADSGRDPAPLPRLVVLVDDFDALVAPALGSPGRPAAGSVVRALESVARDGEQLGVHLVATSSCPNRTSDTDLAQGARLRVVLEAAPVAPAPEDPAPGRGRLGHPDGRVTPFQGGRVTGRIPRTATLRPTVAPLEWERMGDPPARRPVRELGNGPTDLALLASALDRAARSVDAVPVAPLTPAHP